MFEHTEAVPVMADVTGGALFVKTTSSKLAHEPPLLIVQRRVALPETPVTAIEFVEAIRGRVAVPDINVHWPVSVPEGLLPVNVKLPSLHFD